MGEVPRIPGLTADPITPCDGFPRHPRSPVRRGDSEGMSLLGGLPLDEAPLQGTPLRETLVDGAYPRLRGVPPIPITISNSINLPETAPMRDHAANLRRLMARSGLTVQEAVSRTGLHENTIKAILAGAHKPQARTLHRLATGLGVPVDELFQDPSLLVHRAFDRQTNPLVEEVLATHQELLAGWSEADFDELYSRFGAAERSRSKAPPTRCEP